tara:strand:+ start:1861 stop:2007 length:147 start_codon:yes stop_codon:yes gene_type:complete
MKFALMQMPDGVPIAVRIEKDGTVDARVLMLMRNMTWILVRAMNHAHG